MDGERVVAQGEIIPILGLKMIYDRCGIISNCLVLDKDNKVIGQLPIISARSDSEAQGLTKWTITTDSIMVKVEQKYE